MGGYGIAIKKRCSPVVALLVMEYRQGENVTPAARPLRDGPKHRTWLPYRAPARKVTMREDGWKGESIKEKVSKMH